MKRILCVLAFLVSFQVSSNTIGLLEYDYLTTGDNLITYDTESRLQWLDVSYTSNWSMSDFESSDLKNDGWQWATDANVETLFQRGERFTDLNGDGINFDLMALLGPTFGYSNENTINQWVTGTSLAFDWGIGDLRTTKLIKGGIKLNGYTGELWCESDGICLQTKQPSVGFEDQSEIRGLWLVKEVPEPSGIALLSLGLTGVLLARRRKVA